MHNLALEAQAVRQDTEDEPASLSDRVRSLRLPDQPKKTSRRGSWIPWVLCLLLGGSTIVLAYQASNRSDAPEPKRITMRSSRFVPGPKSFV